MAPNQGWGVRFINQFLFVFRSHQKKDRETEGKRFLTVNLLVGKERSEIAIDNYEGLMKLPPSPDWESRHRPSSLFFLLIIGSKNNYPFLYPRRKLNQMYENVSINERNSK